MNQQKTYFLKTSWRSLIIIPGIILGILPIFLFFIYGIGSSTITETICVICLFFIFASVFIFYGLSSRLVTTQFGIEYFFFPPFHFLIPWDYLTSMDIGPFGNVFLLAKPQSFSLINSISKRVQIDPYIREWQNSEFIQDLRIYAPQVIIPDEISHKKEYDFLLRTSTLLLFYISCIMIVLVPSLLFHFNTKLAWKIATSGLLYSTFSGLAELFQYNLWLNSNPDDVRIKLSAKLLYLTPISSWIMLFIIGSIVHFFAGDNLSSIVKNSLDILAISICFCQFLLLQWYFNKKLNER
jgi:hypothetical protein